ncbi:hypothetical protein MALGJ_25480 [Mycolicibacter algericus]|uniref:Uncharacterized protein n=1 Tax=Mycolicibacter algericus TaxID=1288388 RepID=A0A7I9YBG3_MYCAL|nr:hypothetical protein MALGJ_25480 [Mycolicibacter algericus]
MRPVPRHRCGAGLLQRLVTEQPLRRRRQLGQLGRRPAAQQGGLDQGGGAVAEPGPQRGRVGDAGGVGQREPGDLGQVGVAGRRAEVTDVVGFEAEAGTQDGLTPVTITL